MAELDDNFARDNAYAAHALLRAILDHIPPMLGCASFTAVANNYPWTRTDKGYVRRLLDFRLQADDVLHRQITRHPDLLSLEDMPPPGMPEPALARVRERERGQRSHEERTSATQLAATDGRRNCQDLWI